MSYNNQNRLLLESIDGFTVVNFRDGEIVSFADGEIGDNLGARDAVQEVGIQLRNLVESDGCKELLLDFSNVRLFSTALLGELIGLKRGLEEAGGYLKLCGLAAPLVREAFRITGLDRAFEIHSDAQVALDTPWLRGGGGQARPIIVP